jgi:hypothetical protein
VSSSNDLLSDSDSDPWINQVMGYELHICKSRNWLDAENQPIAKEDVAKLIESHPDSIKSPTPDQVIYASGIAKELNAFLVGDDQELYVFTKKYFGLFGPPVMKTVAE